MAITPVRWHCPTAAASSDCRERKEPYTASPPFRCCSSTRPRASPTPCTVPAPHAHGRQWRPLADEHALR
jgi:hypothetical protein